MSFYFEDMVLENGEVNIVWEIMVKYEWEQKVSHNIIIACLITRDDG